MDQLPFDALEAPAKRGAGRPRKWASEAERREAYNEKRRARRDAERHKYGRTLPENAPGASSNPRRAQHATDADDAVAARDAGTLERLERLANPDPLEVRDADLLQLVEEFDAPNVGEAFQYARDVLSARVPACLEVRQACERHERDLQRIADADWPYEFRTDKAERALGVMQMFTEFKGPRKGQALRLSPWQRFVFASIFGWVRKGGGKVTVRRFRYALVAVPRGNGKTTSAAPVGLYMLACDDEGGAEVYSAASTRDQAAICFNAAQEMAKRDSAFRAEFGVTIPARAIVQENSASIFRALSRDADSLDGLNVHLAILDELAKHKSREVHDVLLTALGKRAQPLILAITTAGNNQSGVGFEQWKYARRVLSGDVSDETFFAVLYSIDADDDWRDPASWRKANPNYGVSVNPEHIEAMAKRAERVANLQNAFKQKHLNLWTHAASSWLNMQQWHACADPSLKEEDFAGVSCVVGLDLAAKVDLAARVNLFVREIEGVAHYYVFAHFYLPQAAVEEVRNASYSGWAADGWITTSPGEVTNFTRIQEDVLADARRFTLEDVAFDPWQALKLASELAEQGLSVIEYRPTVANFSPAMKEIDALVREGRLHHNANPVLDWNASCVEVYEDNKGNVYPRKDRDDPLVKIDGVIALLMAYGRRMQLDASDKAPSLAFL